MFPHQFAGSGGLPATLTLSSGQTVLQEVSSPTDAYARLKIDNDGNVYASTDTGSESYTQIGTTTDWIRPTTRAPGDYEVRFTSATNTPTSATAAEDTWHALSSGDFVVYNSVTGTGTKSTTFTIEIRKGSTGAADVSDSFTLNATVTTE
jgi:hypothetical protein